MTFLARLRLSESLELKNNFIESAMIFHSNKSLLSDN